MTAKDMQTVRAALALANTDGATPDFQLYVYLCVVEGWEPKKAKAFMKEQRRARIAEKAAGVAAAKRERRAAR